MKQVKIEWCENWIKAQFTKHHACPGSDAKISVNCFWEMAEKSGLWERGTYDTLMSRAVRELTDIEDVRNEDGEYCYSVFKLKSGVTDSEQPSTETAGQPAPQEADITAMAGKLAFLCAEHNEMMERAHDAERDSAEETDCLKSGDRLYKAIRNAEARLRDAGAEVRRTDGDYPYYHITGAVVKLDGRIVAAYPAENAAGQYVVTGQCRRDLARCETREEAEAVKEKIGGYNVIPIKDYEPPEEDYAAWDFSRKRIEELAAVVAEDVNDPDPEKEWDFDSIGALLAIAGFYGEREDAKMDACKFPEELDALLMDELREVERICNVKIFAAAPDAAA